MAKKKRKYGEGSIRQHAKKNCYTVSYKGKSTSCKTKKLAEMKLKEWKEEYQNLSANEIKQERERKKNAKSITLIEAVRQQLNYKNTVKSNKENTVIRDEDTFNLLKTFEIANVTLDKLTAEQICDDLIKPLQKKRSYSTSKKVYELVHKTIRWGCSRNRNLFSYDILEDVVFPKKQTFEYDTKKMEEDRVKYYTLEQQEMLKEVALETYNNGKLKTHFGYAILFILYSGLRAGEACYLQWKDVDFINKKISINGTVVELQKGKKTYRVEEQPLPKTDKSRRTIDLNDDAFEILNKLYEQNGAYAHVISTTEGRCCTPSNLRKKMLIIVNKIAEKDETIKRVDGLIHALRHTYASNEMLKYIVNSGKGEAVKGNALLWVSKQLGHASVEITNTTYDHMFDLYVRANQIKIA